MNDDAFLLTFFLILAALCAWFVQSTWIAVVLWWQDRHAPPVITITLRLSDGTELQWTTTEKEWLRHVPNYGEPIGDAFLTETLIQCQ